MSVDPAGFVVQLNSPWDADDVPNAVAQLFAEDAVMWYSGDTSGGAPAGRGREQIADAVRLYREPFPDFRETFTFVAQSHHCVVVEWVATGTHTGNAYEGIPASGRRFEFNGVNLFEVGDDGLIKVERSYWNPTVLIRQLTESPPPAAGPDAS